MIAAPERRADRINPRHLRAAGDELDRNLGAPRPKIQRAPATDSFSFADLRQIVPTLSEARARELFPHLEDALLEFRMATFDRAAHFLAQGLWESGGFRFFEEIGEEAYFRSFLGSQWRYHGRGFIMITWQAAYKAASEHFGVDFLKDPDLISRPEWAFRVSCWWWTTYGGHNLNFEADRAQFAKIMSAVLGTSNHPSRPGRWEWYVRCCQNLPIPWRVDGMLRTNGDRILAHLWPALDRVDYAWWLRGDVPDGPMAYGKNAPPPSAEQLVRDNAMFCQAPHNIGRRLIGKVVPTKGDPRYDGGIAAAWGGVYGPGYYEGYYRPFDPGADYPHMTAVGSEFWGANRQGHTGFILGNGKVLDCNSVDGLQARRWQGNSHALYGPYEKVVLPFDWCNYQGDER